MDGRTRRPGVAVVDKDQTAATIASAMGAVEACARFTRATGYPSAIGALTDVVAVFDGTVGTTITDRARTVERAGPNL